MARTVRMVRSAVVVLGGAITAAIVMRIHVSGIASADAVRFALGVCGIGFFAVAIIYARDGRSEQLAGHLLASVGFLIVAVGGSGRIVWLGIALLGIGGCVLLQDALGRGGHGGTSM